MSNLLITSNCKASVAVSFFGVGDSFDDVKICMMTQPEMSLHAHDYSSPPHFINYKSCFRYIARFTF